MKSHFKESWQNTKNTSPKMAFYNRVKHEFCKEKYLDHVNNYYDRANLTKLRISAHELQIEMGRRKNIPREERHCKWCKISIGMGILEDEEHLLYSCDLYSPVRQNSLQIISKLTGTKILHTDFMSLLNQINNFPTINIQATPHVAPAVPTLNTQTLTSEGHLVAHDQQRANSYSEQLRLSSKSVLCTIAKLVTLCFERRKNLIAPRTTETA